METKINIAAILKDKPQGTKLYSSACGKCELKEADDKSFKVSFYSSKFGFMNGGEGTFDKNGNLYDDGECIIFPSKEMRDWSKFAWKKGDILVNKDGNVHIIFDGFENDTYKTFHGQYYLWEEGGSIVNFEEDENYMQTSDYNKANKEDAQEYIRKIEKRLGGKLNRETLGIEKALPEFNDGDIVYAESNAYHYPSIHILNINGDTKRYYARLVINGRYDEAVDYDIPAFDEDNPNRLRYAIEAEKQQLFSALAKEGKVWDAEKKAIVDLKPKVEFKPFDRCIWKIRNYEGSIWQASFVSYVDEYGATPMGMSIDEDLVNLIILPYNEETAHLLGTTDEWKGGEQ